MVTKTKEVGIRLSVKDKEVVERALKEVGVEGAAALKRIEQAAKPASVSLQALNAATSTSRTAIGAFTAGAFASLAPILSFAAAVEGARRAMDLFGDIADKSKAAGLDPEFFQGLAYAAKLTGVDMDQLSSSLETFAKNAGQAAEGRGKMILALKTENPELLKNLQLAKSQEERIRLVADAIDHEHDAAKKAALSSALFGDSGTKIAAAFEGGAAALDKTIAKARDLGIIIDRDMIARGDELGDKFDTVTTILGTKFAKVLIELAPLLVWTAEVAGGLATAINLVIEGLKGLEFKSTETLERRLAGIKQTLADNAQPQLQTDPNGRITVANPMALQLPDDEVKKLEEEQKQIETVLANRPKFADTPTAPPALPPNDAAKAAIKEAEALVKRARTAAQAYSDTLDTLKVGLKSGAITQAEFDQASGDAALAFAKAADSSTEYADALARLNEAKALGVLSEKQYTDAVESLTKKRLLAQNDWLAGVQLGLQNLKVGADDVTTSVAGAVENWASSLGEQIGSVFRTGKFEWKDLVNTILADVAKIATQQLITKPLGALLGSLFGGIGGGINLGTGSSSLAGGASFLGGIGHNAGGTDNWRGGPSWVGENGPEVVNLPKGSQVIPNHRIGGTTIQLAPVYQISAAGLSEAQLQRVLELNNRQLLDSVPAAVKKASAKGAFG